MKLHRVAGALLVAFACAGAVQTAPASSATPAIWIDVPFVAQTKDGCGSAAISMVMQYWDGKEGRTADTAADANKIQDALFSPTAGGIYASRMRQYFQDSGYRAFAFKGQWSDIQRQLQLGRPLIAALKMDGIHGPLHYVVIVGIDSERGYVFVNDPARQKMLRTSKNGFESEWSRTHNWTLLAVPQTDH